MLLLLSRSICLPLGVQRLLRRFSLVLLLREHPREGSARCAVAALTGEAEESRPDEGTAAGEGGPQVQRHQRKVQKLGGVEDDSSYSANMLLGCVSISIHNSGS